MSDYDKRLRSELHSRLNVASFMIDHSMHFEFFNGDQSVRMINPNNGTSVDLGYVIDLLSMTDLTLKNKLEYLSRFWSIETMNNPGERRSSRNDPEQSGLRTGALFFEFLGRPNVEFGTTLMIGKMIGRWEGFRESQDNDDYGFSFCSGMGINPGSGKNLISQGKQDAEK